MIAEVFFAEDMGNYFNDLNKKTAIVTGGSQGIGYAIAEAYCKNGASIALIDISELELAKAKDKLQGQYPGTSIESFVCNVADPKAVNKVFEAVSDRFGRIDRLVNNAGILRRAMIEEMSQENWEAVLSVNLTGVFNCCRAVLSGMKKAGGGVIINVSSNVAAMPSVGMGAYCVSKTGVETLTRVLAAEYAPYDIRVNAYAPGVVETEMTRDILKKRADEKLKTIPIGRFTQPEEIAELAMFLSSDAAASINGTVVGIDGGILATHNPWKAKK